MKETKYYVIEKDIIHKVLEVLSMRQFISIDDGNDEDNDHEVIDIMELLQRAIGDQK